MKIKDLIKELDTFDAELDVECTVRGGDTYDIIDLDVAHYINGNRRKPFCRLSLSSFNIKR